MVRGLVRSTVLLAVSLVFCAAPDARSSQTSRDDFLRIVRGEGCESRVGAMLRADAYLAGLPDGELILFLDELAESQPGCLYRSPVMYHLLRRWERVPVEALGPAVADPARCESFRRFLLDFLVSSLRREARNGSPEAAGNLGSTGDLLIGVAASSGSEDLRGEALAGLSTLATCVRRFENPDRERLQAWGERAVAFLAAREEGEVVRGQAARLLLALDDHRGFSLLRSIVLEPESRHPFLSCCAVSCLARMGDRDEIPVVAELARRASTREVYEAAVRALLLFRDPAVLVPIMETCDRFDGEAAKAVLNRSGKVVEMALLSSNGRHLRAAAQAVGFAGLVQFKDNLVPLVAHEDPLVRLAAVESLLRVGDGRDRARLRERAGHESDPAVLELLEHIE